MLRIEIHDKACRGCQMCVDICPTDVFAFDDMTMKASVKTVEDCIACLSCSYLCPSHAITHFEYHITKNFYRDREFTDRIGKFL